MIKPYLVQYLKYVQNTGGNVTVAGFDDDWEPIGPRLREELMPHCGERPPSPSAPCSLSALPS
jgi:hypothetical protein